MPPGHLYEKHVYHESGDGGDFLGGERLFTENASPTFGAPYMLNQDSASSRHSPSTQNDKCKLAADMLYGILRMILL
jgi:hypothetical protein